MIITKIREGTDFKDGIRVDRYSPLGNPYPVSMGRELCVKHYLVYATLILRGGYEPHKVIELVGVTPTSSFYCPTRADYMKAFLKLRSSSILYCHCHQTPYTVDEDTTELAWDCHGEALAYLYYQILLPALRS